MNTDVVRINAAKYLGVIGVVLVAMLAVEAIVLGGTKQTDLSSASPLVGQVSQALVTNNDNPSLAVPDSDFKLTDVKYFDNNIWVIATVTPQTDTFNQSIVVMKKQSGVYQPILGPGSAFTPDDLRNVPNDVAANLTERGAIYVPILN